MSSRIHGITRAVAIAAMLALSCSPAFAQQSDDPDAEMRIQQLENRLRQLTGQNEELQYRNRQLEERLRALQGGAQAHPADRPPRPQPSIAAAPPPQPDPADPAAARSSRGPASRRSQRRRRSSRSPRRAAAGARPAPWRCLRSQPESECPGRAAGARRRPAADSAEAPVGAPGGRGAGEPLDLANTGGPRNPAGALPPPRTPGAAAALTTLPPSATPKDEFDLGIGYMQRKDYALAEETMRSLRAEISRRSPAGGFAILARREFFPAPALSRRRGILPRGDHQIR